MNQSTVSYNPPAFLGPHFTQNICQIDVMERAEELAGVK